MKWRKKETRHRSDPSFLFSTWPVPRWNWVFGQSEMVVSSPGSSFEHQADFIYHGPQDQPKLQRCLDRLAATSGRVMMMAGTFELAGPLDISGTENSVIACNYFTGAGLQL